MSLFVVMMLLCIMSIGLATGASSGSRFRKSVDEADVSGSELYQQNDHEYGAGASPDLLDVLLIRPSKRLWCRKGMTYNHVLGSCTPTFTAIRGKGRRQQH